MNPFDQLNGNGLNGLEGFSFSKAFKKVKDAVKKVDKKLGIDKVKKAIGLDKVEKATDKAILQTAAEIKRSPVAQAALVAGAVMVAGPAGLALAKSAGGAIVGGLSKVGGALATVAKSGAVKAIVGGVGKVAAVGGKALATQALTQMAQGAGAPQQYQQYMTDKTGPRIDSAINDIANDPRYAALVAQMRAQGYSDEQIAQYWATSEAYRQAAVPAIAQTVYPQAYAAYQQQGYSPAMAQDMAYKTSDMVAEDTVTKIQDKMSGMDWLKIGLPVAAMLLTLVNR